MTGWILALAAPMALSFAICALLLRTSWSARLSDHPNERSLHTRPTPRIGGVALMLAALPLAFALSTPSLDIVWMLALGLALVSFADDLRSLPIAIRLPAHFAAAVVAAAAIAPAWPAVFLLATAIGLAWMTNLYNFMDGADGLAGGMAVVGFGAYAIAAAQAGSIPFALACAVIAAAALGFLAFNFPPARAFMGDAGSIPLGFLAGALGLHGFVIDAWPFWFPLLVFSPFIVDASVTIARRVLRRERFWVAHRTHAYQRLVLSGWSARRLASSAYALMLATSVSAIAARTAVVANQYAILAVWVLLYLVVVLAIESKRPLDGASS